MKTALNRGRHSSMSRPLLHNLKKRYAICHMRYGIWHMENGHASGYFPDCLLPYSGHCLRAAAGECCKGQRERAHVAAVERSDVANSQRPCAVPVLPVEGRERTGRFE